MDRIVQTRIMEAGVPQGSVVGPLLWDLIFDKLLRAKVEKNGCRLLAYADDTLIVSTGATIEKVRRKATLQVACNKEC